MTSRPTGTVTFLFTDIEGSTWRWERDPDAMRDAVAQHDTIVRAAIERHHGFVFSTGGDGFAAAFARAGDAVRCAADAQLALQRSDLPPVRMGIHTGEADERDGDYFGGAVNRAARLMALAHGGQVVVSRPTAEIITGFVLVDLGEHQLRDLARPERVFQLVVTGLRSEFPPLRSILEPPTLGGEGVVGAPEPLTSFIGREPDLERCAAALDSHRLVTIVAPGGMGKTRLATEVARRSQPVRGWFVDLVPASATSLVATVAAAIGATERPNQSLEDIVHETLREKPALLVLDNCEHVLDEVARLTDRALRVSPELTVLATSREPLGVPGEHVVPLAPLGVEAREDSAAVTLFVERARDTGAAIADGDRDTVRDIVARVDGIPLAIELAAARAATFGVDGIRAGLADPLRLLSGGRRRDERHRSLRDVLDWSHALLEDDERHGLRNVSVFQGAFTADDAERVLETDLGTALDVLGRLTAKSLLVLVPASGRSTYRMLEIVREYARARLDEAGETAAARDRHVAWCIEVARQIVAGLDADDELDARAVSVVDDLRVALAWAQERGDRDRARELARTVARVAYARLFITEAEESFALAAALAASEADAAVDLVEAANSAFALVRGDHGLELLLDAAARAERGGDNRLAALTLAVAAERCNRFVAVFSRPPDHDEVLATLQHATDLAPPGDPIVDAQLAVSAAWLSTGRKADASPEAAERALALARAAGDPVVESSALDALGAARWSTEQRAESVELSRARVQLLSRMPTTHPSSGLEQTDILHMAADSLLSVGDLRAAADQARRAVEHPRGRGAMHVVTRELVIALVLTGRFADALDHSAVMRAAWERAGRPPAGWMAPAADLVALTYGLRGSVREYDEWREITRAAAGQHYGMRGFCELRLAMHTGDRDGLAEALTRQLNAVAQDDLAAVPWTGSSIGGWYGYVWPLAAEALVLLGDEDAGARVETVRDAFFDHLWAQACTLRAQGRLTGARDTIVRAAEAFDAIDAVFEAAFTRMLLGGDDEAAARAVLADLGCTLPATG